MDVLCVGCIDDLSWKSNDRRNSESDSSKPVLELWKTFSVHSRIITIIIILVDRHAVTHATQEVLIASFGGETRLPDL